MPEVLLPNFSLPGIGQSKEGKPARDITYVLSQSWKTERKRRKMLIPDARSVLGFGKLLRLNCSRKKAIGSSEARVAVKNDRFRLENTKLETKNIFKNRRNHRFYQINFKVTETDWFFTFFNIFWQCCQIFKIFLKY